MAAAQPSNKRVFLAIFGAVALLSIAAGTIGVAAGTGRRLSMSFPVATLVGALAGCAAIAVMFLCFKLAGLRIPRLSLALGLVGGGLAGAYELPLAILSRATVRSYYNVDMVDFVITIGMFLFVVLAGVNSFIVARRRRKR